MPIRVSSHSSLMDDIAIEIGESCPAGLEVLQNQSSFTLSLSPSGGVGKFEILGMNEQIILIGQKHSSTISLLENASRSEVLTVDISNVADMTISCPPTEEIAFIQNTNITYCKPGSFNINSKGDLNPAMNFTWQQQNLGLLKNNAYCYKVMNHESKVVANVDCQNRSSLLSIKIDEDLSAVQKAVIFGGLSFLVCTLKHRRRNLILVNVGILFLLFALFLVYLMV